MIEEARIKKDLEYIKKIEKRVSEKKITYAYIVGFVSCLLVHCIYFSLFVKYNITIMAYFNVFSVLFYLVEIYLTRKVKNQSKLILASLVEIIIHAAFATVCVGWGPDFGMFLLMVIPIVFLMPNNNRNIAFAFMYISLFLYGILRYIYHNSERAIYTFDNPKVVVLFYVINFVIGAFVLIYITGIYTITDMYLEAKLRVQNHKLSIIASIDPLTQIFNRRAMNEMLKKISADSKKFNTTYIIGLGDIDDFKHVNDTYGHNMGDEVLKKIANIISANIPKEGYFARWGGEEFLFVIPFASLEHGKKCADDIVEKISKEEFSKGTSKYSVTMTIGVCEGTATDDIEKVINKADKLLYKGKNNGKNQVVTDIN